MSCVPVLQGSDPQKSHLSPPFGRILSEQREVKALKVTRVRKWRSKRRAIRIKAPKNKEGIKVMSMDHTVKNAKLNTLKQTRYEGGNCDYRGQVQELFHGNDEDKSQIFWSLTVQGTSHFLEAREDAPSGPSG